MLASLDRSYRAAPLFSMIFCKIGNASPDPAADFTEVGVGPDYAHHHGMYCYSPGSPVEDRAWRDAFLALTSLGKLTGSYLRHPGCAASLVGDDLGHAAWRNPDPILGIRLRSSACFRPTSSATR